MFSRATLVGTLVRKRSVEEERATTTVATDVTIVDGSLFGKRARLWEASAVKAVVSGHVGLDETAIEIFEKSLIGLFFVSMQVVPAVHARRGEHVKELACESSIEFGAKAP